MIFKMHPFEALPCALEEFIVNGYEADTDDFGSGHDHRDEVCADDYDEDLLTYACCNWYWTRDNSLAEKTCKKYYITKEEFDEICDALESTLHVGTCGWCI